MIVTPHKYTLVLLAFCAVLFPLTLSQKVEAIETSEFTSLGASIKNQILNQDTLKIKGDSNSSSGVNQNEAATANTGNNEASRNISIGGNAGIIDTGNATVNNIVASSANNNGVHSGNATVISQAANTVSTTGENKADRNISIGGKAGTITTGNASSDTNFLVSGNGSVALVGGNTTGKGPGSGASVLLSDSDRKNRFHSYTTGASYSSQSCGENSSGVLYNLSGCAANTGNNSANRGISFGGNAGEIQTADAQVNVLMSANSNHSQTNQYVNAYANTGNNTANRNISIGGNAGVIQTGNALVNVLTLGDLSSF